MGRGGEGGRHPAPGQHAGVLHPAVGEVQQGQDEERGLGCSVQHYQEEFVLINRTGI